MQQHKVSSSPDSATSPARWEPLCLLWGRWYSTDPSHAAPLLCCHHFLGRNKDAVIGNFASVWPFLSQLLVWRSSAQSAALPLCVGSSHTVQHKVGLCAGQVPLSGSRVVLLDTSMATVTGSVTNCMIIGWYCVCWLLWCHWMCSMFSAIRVHLLALCCQSKQSKSCLRA